MSILHTNNFATTQASGSAGLSSGAISSTLSSTTGLTAPCYLAYDATNINGAYEIVKILAVPGGGVVTHAALINNHTVSEEIRCVLPAEEINPALTVDTPSATPEWDLSTSLHQMTMAASISSMTVKFGTIGQTFVIRLVQGGTGSYTAAWFTGIDWCGGVAPVLTTTVGKTDTFGFIIKGAGSYAGYVVGQSE
jgi:hypothetical protein